MVTIYTDGAARGNPGPGGWGAIIADDVVKELGGREDHTTNNRMELTAAIEALKQVSSGEITVFTDSEYVMKGITLWIHSWQKNNWRTAGKKPVLNKDLWEHLLGETIGKKIEWKYVRGHFGHKTNERADVIATSFADNEPVKLYSGPVSKYEFI